MNEDEMKMMLLKKLLKEFTDGDMESIVSKLPLEDVPSDGAVSVTKVSASPMDDEDSEDMMSGEDCDSDMSEDDAMKMAATAHAGDEEDDESYVPGGLFERLSKKSPR